MIRGAALIVLLATPAGAQDGPEADAAGVRACLDGAAPYDIAPACIGAASNACQMRAGGSTTIGIVGCLSSEAAAWDVLLNEEYGLLRDELRAADAAGGPEQASRADALRHAQRAWIAFRDADCALTSAIWQDGTVRGPVAAQCLQTHTARRTLELRDLRRNGEEALLMPPALPAAAQSSDGPTADPAAVWACREGAAPYDDAPACIGDAANACQTQTGGASTLGIVACLSSEDAAWDALLNEEYGILRDDLRAEDARGTTQDMSRVDAIRDAQRAWIAFRDADCSLARSIRQDGTIRGPVAAQCRLSHTARRTLQLRNLRRGGEGEL